MRTTVKQINQGNELCRRLDEILGIGSLTVTATYVAAGDGKDFVNGRHFSAWLAWYQGSIPLEGRTPY